VRSSDRQAESSGSGQSAVLRASELLPHCPGVSSPPPRTATLAGTPRVSVT